MREVNNMAILFWFASFLFATGCSSLPRTKWSDPGMTVFIDPDTVDSETYSRILNALVSQNKFRVVDRAEAHRAVKREQEREHRSEADRYENKSKYSWWGRLVGARTIIVPRVQCRTEHSFWHHDRAEKHCLQSLQAINANTGEVFLSVEGENSAPISYDMTFIVPDWEEAVSNFTDRYPGEWERRYFSKELEIYRSISENEALKQQEEVTNQNSGSLLLAPRPK